MKKMIMMFFMALAAVCGTVSAQGLVVIQGQVTDLDTGKPMRGVRVSEYGTDNRILHDVQTDSDGRYLIRITSGNTLSFASVVETQRRSGLTEDATVDVQLRRATASKYSSTREKFRADGTTFFIMPLMGVQVNRGGGYAVDWYDATLARHTETLLATGAMLSASYGAMAGVARTLGGYVKYRYAETEKQLLTMTSPELRAGLLWQMERDFFLYAGGGVDLFKLKRNDAAQDQKETWPAVEAGLVIRRGWLGLSAGVGYVFSHEFFSGNSARNDLGFDFGIGVML